MKTSRRSFFNMAGIAGAGILTGGLSSFTSKINSEFSANDAGVLTGMKGQTQLFNMCGYAAPKIETVRVGFIGLGQRGPGAVERMANITPMVSGLFVKP